MPIPCLSSTPLPPARFLTPFLLACTILTLSLTSSAQEVESDDSTQNAASEIEQIIVVGERSPFRLRAQIKEAEKRLFSTYNEVNENEDYDVDCDKYTPTMSHISEQRCWPVFFHNVVAEEAQRAMLLNDFNIIPPNQLATLYAGEFEKLRANIVAVANEHPEVATALMEYGGLQQALKETMEICRQGKRVLLILYKCTESDSD